MIDLTLSHAAIAMEASSSSGGSGFSPQSVSAMTSPSGPAKSGTCASARMDGTSTPSARPIIICAAISTSPVVFTWPQNVQSTSPRSSRTMA